MKSETIPGIFAGAKGGLFDRDRPVALAQLERDGARLAGTLRSLGVRAGDRVAVWLPNVAAWLVMLVACGRLGAILVAVNTRFRSAEVADIVARARCKVLLYWPGFRNIDFSGILAACDPRALESIEIFIAYGEEADAPAHHRYQNLLAQAPWEGDDSGPDAGCLIFTTSGTTRLPKFVLHDQKTLIRHGRDAGRKFGYTEPGARVLVAAPLCGAFGFCTAMAAIASDCPAFLYPAWDAVEAAQSVRCHAITHTNATDEAIAQMLDAVPGSPAFPSARYFGYATFSPALADLPRRAEARGLKLVGLYGSSELQALIARQSENAPVEARMTAGGTLVAARGRVRARNPDTNEVLPDGVAGELEFDVPSRMAGYFEDRAATQAAFTADGWFRSGDLGRTVAGGGFAFVARMGDALRLSGFLVSPAEIEDVLQQSDLVEAAQVVGIATPSGTRPFAFVILRPGAAFDEPALLAHCAARMARHKVPLQIAPLAEFPSTASANATKIQKARLREMAREAFAKRAGSAMLNATHPGDRAE